MPAFHRMGDLFAQLGLPAEEVDVGAFIARHRPLAGDVALCEAPFWTPAQAALLAQQAEADADWAELVDQLNLALR
ncbi:MAG: DUF2789 family protein [Burkholderiales bacterium]|nr:DUF2789 family protein [Burkholderiales bacterium]